MCVIQFLAVPLLFVQETQCVKFRILAGCQTFSQLVFLLVKGRWSGTLILLYYVKIHFISHSNLTILNNLLLQLHILFRLFQNTPPPN